MLRYARSFFAKHSLNSDAITTIKHVLSFVTTSSPLRTLQKVFDNLNDYACISYSRFLRETYSGSYLSSVRIPVPLKRLKTVIVLTLFYFLLFNSVLSLRRTGGVIGKRFSEKMVVISARYFGKVWTTL